MASYSPIQGGDPLDLLGGPHGRRWQGIYLSVGARNLGVLERLNTAESTKLDGKTSTVVAKATDKDRDRRYATASDLGLDLRNYLAHQPILARPPSTFYLLRKFARRHRTLVASVATILLTMSIALVVVLQQIRVVRAERTRARQISSFTSGILVESDLMRAKGPDFTVREALDEAAAQMARAQWDDPEIEGELLGTIGGSFEGLSLY